MTFTNTAYHTNTGCKGQLSFSPEELVSGRFSGQAELALPEADERTVRFSVDEIEDVHIAPYEIVVGPGSQSKEVSFRITGKEPYITFSSDQNDSDEEFPIYRFDLPDLTTIELCLQFLEEGLTDSLLFEIRERYDSGRSPLHRFIQDAKNCLPYPQYIQLLAESTATDDLVQKDLASGRHGFVKNLIRGQKVGNQFPIRDHSEFNSRTTEYEAHQELEPLDRVRIIERLIGDASNHDTHIDDICGLDRVFVEMSDQISTGFFVNLASEALLTEFSVGTVTNTFDNSFQTDVKDLVKHRFDDWEVSSQYEDLRELASVDHIGFE